MNPIQYHPSIDLNLGRPVGSGLRDDLKIDLPTHNWSTGLQTGSGLMIGSPKIQQKQQQSKNEVENSEISFSNDSSFCNDMNGDTSMKELNSEFNSMKSQLADKQARLSRDSGNGGATYQFYLNGGSASLDNRTSGTLAKEQAKFQVLKKSQAEVLSKKKIRKRSGYL